MAMLHHFGFSCWVSSDGKKLPLYNEESDENTKTAWIPSEVGQNFSVSWQDTSGKRIPTSGHVFVDGKDVASAIIRPGRTTPVERSGAKQGPHKIKPFKFANLSLTDDDELADPGDNRMKDVGTIRVEIKRVRLGGEVPFEGYKVPESELVHERAKKAGAHCTKFDEAKRVTDSKTVAITTAPYDPNEPGPYVIFEFRYRSFDILKANGIVDVHRKRVKEARRNIIDVGSSDEDEDDRIIKGEPQSPRKRIKREPVIDNDALTQDNQRSQADSSEVETKPIIESSQDSPENSQQSPQENQAQNAKSGHSPAPNASLASRTAESDEVDELDEDREQFALPLDPPPPSSSPEPYHAASED